MAWYTLDVAVRMQHVDDMIRFLEDGDVNLELRGKNGNTLLHDAVGGHGPLVNAVVDTLLHYGANALTINDHGETTVHTAAHTNNPVLVHKLIRLGVNADLACTRCGATPLHIAALNSCVDVIQVLIDSGVNQSHRDPAMDSETCQREGWTALDFAREMIRVHDLRVTGRFPELFHLFALYVHRKWDSKAAARYQTVKMLEVAEVHTDKMVAFAMGHHRRLGEGSMPDMIDPNVLKLILDEYALEVDPKIIGLS